MLSAVQAHIKLDSMVMSVLCLPYTSEGAPNPGVVAVRVDHLYCCSMVTVFDTKV